ncbi:thiamine phosphate synthase [Flavobacterium johnsoniae]|uniref:Thiamine-phosphate synthase n=1 Tax=Flavobacterium johnsoniae (strain ATCC 17061 / DSM 2064 / JCM 8514 / BCRC 14874 / CCUG 350202 / NBRC 14942 / NCIMB 11054 / UW101) TaxID=376686 RepID=THIE_FLAJ1|nr:thiamine phosphate synthase [Flavobacterium johnsoniae]A5FJJ1.1 RecName: Full=Thiamine-phosphate synthase; Short=TP synthase; Short=TPS; AltName: Full=Thiamine-phosphate pyrophosphorylase; Short=TMP pyrophosphorylase; Short=TMP-PPase [Flavobacterium johnsoniae UW101]ABQ04632.1 Thiamine-phosphate diphosphorylase [Flavobacterium johnsoniae UW101]OXE97953.1 thiamine phosphate synthase [Flavobacterium johnsoniae UW101]WQG83572.1 thiamine phosphate synthase [Flavobacterium johnsoniae UW101]SHK28
MYNKLQYISQGNTIEDQVRNIHQALDSGCDWIQMRFKNQTEKDSFILAEEIKLLCEKYLASFIINDNLYLAQQINADGVHLGLSDMKIDEARTILGAEKIIGGTANTFEDIQNHVKNGCNYIGLGPFRFTNTKEKLSPILGLSGYFEILQKMKKNKIEVPVYAIGGITLKDINPLMETGIHGIAVSGIITESDEKKILIQQLNEKLYANVIV